MHVLKSEHVVQYGREVGRITVADPGVNHVNVVGASSNKVPELPTYPAATTHISAARHARGFSDQRGVCEEVVGRREEIRRTRKDIHTGERNMLTTLDRTMPSTAVNL